MKSLVFLIALLVIGLYFYSWSFFATIFVMSVLVFFHELGHFMAARAVGVNVNVFSIGFGQKLLKKRIGATEYAISAIPLGGYVQLKGQDDTDPKNKNFDPDSYNSKIPAQRIFILIAGPAFNFILAFFIFIYIGFAGIERLAPIVGSVMDDSSAKSAGVVKNDKILSINDVKISQWDEIRKNVTAKELRLKIERKGEILELNIIPKIAEATTIFGEKIKRPMLGISPSGDSVKLHYKGIDAIKYALNETYNASKLIFEGLQKLIIGIVPLKELGGIVQITDITSKAAQSDFISVLIIAALISVNLGVLNLLPIPALDGGHILFNLYELIFRREVSEKVFVWLTYAGWAVLLALMVVATFNDINRLMQG